MQLITKITHKGLYLQLKALIALILLYPVQMEIGDTSVKVGVRVRPLSNSEVNDGSSTCLSYPNEENQLIIGNDRLFGFDYVFKETDSQEHVYKKAALPMVESILKGYNATLPMVKLEVGKHIQWVHVSLKVW
ncbi:unnamed protein product [Schistosoma guineensis]|nr:unnamed protein product [Schistosoma guineensis]